MDRPRDWMDEPVVCPAGHVTGRQDPLYEQGAATGEFSCGVCRRIYVPDAANQNEGRALLAAAQMCGEVQQA